MYTHINRNTKQWETSSSDAASPLQEKGLKSREPEESFKISPPFGILSGSH